MSNARQQIEEARRLVQAAQFDAASALLIQLLAGDLTAAESTEALYTLAVARRYGHDLDGALRTLDELIEREPGHSRAYQERGHAYLALNRPEDAAAAFAKALELNPGLLASWKSLANLHKHLGNAEQAAFAAAQARYLDELPRELAAVTDLMHDGKLYKAEKLCRHYLQQNPHHIEAMRLLAEIGVRLRVYDDAEFLLESCVELAPDNQRARSDYLAILNRKGKFEQAYEQAKRLYAGDPDNPVHKLSMANALTGLGRTEEGLAMYRDCLDKIPNRAGVQVMVGHTLKNLGVFDEAVEAYREAYRLKPDYGDAFWSLANTKTYEFTDEEIARIEREEDAASVSEDDRIHLCFAAGKALEDRHDFDRAFEYYARGNELKRRQLGYDPDKTDAMVEAQIDVCTPELFEQRGQLGLDCPDPIFIVGLPRAGSTLLEQILASNSLVDGTMELHNILGLAQRLRGRSAERESKYPRILWELEGSYFERFGQQFIDDTRVYRDRAPFFIDKMPNNFLHIGLIHLILPNAKIIDARRQPMACCFSGFKQLFGEGQDFTYGLDAIGRYYRAYVRLMDHWDEVLPGYVLRVQHEDVVADLESQVRRMLDFCGLPFEQSCLEFHKTKRTVRTPSAEQVRQPIYTSGLDQWRNFDSHLDPLREALGEDLLAGYPLESDAGAVSTDRAPSAS